MDAFAKAFILKLKKPNFVLSYVEDVGISSAVTLIPSSPSYGKVIPELLDVDVTPE